MSPILMVIVMMGMVMVMVMMMMMMRHHANIMPVDNTVKIFSTRTAR